MNQLSRYDVVIFDCDGVIFDSNSLKIQAMRDSLEFLSIPDAVIDQCCSFFSLNFGKSRFYHVDYFVNNLIVDYAGSKIELYNKILNLYSSKTRELYLNAKVTPNFISLLNVISTPKYIASGSDEKELRLVFEQRNMASKFDAIYGSPTSKSENVNNIIENGNFKNSLMIGDALSDLDAAISNDIDFLGYLPFSNVSEQLKLKASEYGFKCIKDWSELMSNDMSLTNLR